MRVVARQALLLASKDIRLFFKDRFGFGFAMIFPLMFVFGFSIALSDVGPEDRQLRFAVATEEEQGLSREVIAALTVEGSGVDEWTADDASQAVEDGDLSGFVLFPDDFTQSVFGSTGAQINVVVSGDDPAFEAALHGLAQTIAGRVNTLTLAARGAAQIEGLGSVRPERLAELAQAPPLVWFTTDQVGDREPFNASNFTLPGYLTMFVFFVAALGAEAIARERQSQTLERLLSNGVRRSSIIGGKLLTGIYRGLMQLAVLWVAGILIFSIDFGSSPAAVVGVSVAMVLASAAFGVMLASMVQTVNSATSTAVLTSLTFAPLGGSWWPLFIAPEWQQTLGKLTPHGWANDAFNKLMLFGAEAGDVIVNIGALLLLAAVFLVVAVLKFRSAPTN